MKKLNNIFTLVIAGLLTAFTCIATMIIQVPTPGGGYIHIGDTFVVLSGVILGPVLGGLAAGIGSLLADGLSGYAVYMLPTFLIKFSAAAICGLTYQKIKKRSTSSNVIPALLTGAVLSELIVIFGYFCTEVIFTMMLNSSVSGETLIAGITSALGGIFMNCLQGTAGIVLALALYPLLVKIPNIRQYIVQSE